MKEEQLVVKIKRTRKYNSYQGEISPAVDNLINRNFSASEGADIFLDYLSDQSKSMSVLYRTQIS